MSSLIVEVVRIGEIERHPNADTLCLTTVKGWNCIIKDGQFKPTDLAVYIPIDAVVPEWMTEEYDLSYLKNGERVKTIKLRGVLSQGLLLTAPARLGSVYEGMNVAERLGITKWEPPAPSYQGTPNLAKATKNRPNPNFTRYCDPENIKHYPNIFEDGEDVVITEKIYGTNARFGNVPRNWGDSLWAKVKRFLTYLFAGEYEFAVGSRNVHLVGDNPQFYEGNIYHQIAKRYDLASIIPEGATIYGEIYGDKIQDLTYSKRNGEIDVVFFDLKRGDKYVPYSEFEWFCFTHDLPTVPLLYRGAYSNELVEAHTSGRSVLAPSQIREGCVIKSATEENDRHIGRKILKSISPDYQLRKGGTEFH